MRGALQKVNPFKSSAQVLIWRVFFWKQLQFQGCQRNFTEQLLLWCLDGAEGCFRRRCCTSTCKWRRPQHQTGEPVWLWVNCSYAVWIIVLVSLLEPRRDNQHDPEGQPLQVFSAKGALLMAASCCSVHWRGRRWVFILMLLLLLQDAEFGERPPGGEADEAVVPVKETAVCDSENHTHFSFQTDRTIMLECQKSIIFFIPWKKRVLILNIGGVHLQAWRTPLFLCDPLDPVCSVRQEDREKAAQWAKGTAVPPRSPSHWKIEW